MEHVELNPWGARRLGQRASVLPEALILHVLKDHLKRNEGGGVVAGLEVQFFKE